MQAHELAPGHRAHLFQVLLERHRQQDQWDTVFQLLQQGQRAAREAQLPEMVKKMEEGQTVVLQGLRESGKFLEWELSLLEVGLATGNIEESYRRLMEHYRLQEHFAADARRQLWAPALITAAVLVAMYGWLVIQQQIGVVTAVLCGLGAGVAMVGVWALSLRLIRRDLSGTGSARVHSGLRKLPILGGVIRAAQIQHYFNNLSQAIRAALPLEQALRMAARKVPDSAYRQEFMAVREAVGEGQRLSAALASCGLLNGVYVAPLSARNAGPKEAIQHLAQAVRQHYLEQLQLLARWLPQLLYVLLPVVAVTQVAVL